MKRIQSDDYISTMMDELNNVKKLKEDPIVYKTRNLLQRIIDIPGLFSTILCMACDMNDVDSIQYFYNYQYINKDVYKIYNSNPIKYIFYKYFGNRLKMIQDKIGFDFTVRINKYIISLRYGHSDFTTAIKLLMNRDDSKCFMCGLTKKDIDLFNNRWILEYRGNPVYQKRTQLVPFSFYTPARITPICRLCREKLSNNIMEQYGDELIHPVSSISTYIKFRRCPPELYNVIFKKMRIYTCNVERTGKVWKDKGSCVHAVDLPVSFLTFIYNKVIDELKTSINTL